MGSASIYTVRYHQGISKCCLCSLLGAVVEFWADEIRGWYCMQLVCSRLIIFFVLGQKTRTCTARLTRLGDNYKQIPYIPEKYGYVRCASLSITRRRPYPLKSEYGDSYFSEGGGGGPDVVSLSVYFRELMQLFIPQPPNPRPGLGSLRVPLRMCARPKNRKTFPLDPY